MKEEILKRAMFAMPLSKKAQGTGIMAGFDMDEMDSEEGDLKEMPPMARTPQNPEILMNTLRGDMRSVDARYQELADMVGEEAAMETPPEVLAMLQPKFATPPEGIGALPQAQAMMPPGADMPPPDQMGTPQPAPAMPQGGIPMPEGMESAPPFSPGAEEAPQGYAIGGIVRGAQALGARGVDALGRGAQQANQYLGNMFMSPQPTLQRMTGGTPPMNLVVPANQSLVQAPSGAIAQGVGGQLVPRMAMGPLTAPTFTQGLATGARQFAEQFPRAADALKTMFPMAALGAATLQSVGSRKPVDPEAEAREARRLADIDKIPTKDVPVVAPMVPKIPVAPMLSAVSEKPVAVAVTEEEQAAIDDKQLITSDKTKADSLSSFIDKKLKPSSKIDRIKAGQAEYAPLFEELLGSDKESAKINALLLLSEAGLKLASTAKPTFAMAVAESFSGVPRGFAAIAAQERELGMKVKTAALQQAITDVTSQDAAAAAEKKLFLEYTMKESLERAKREGIIYKNAGAGGRTGEDKNGNYKGFFIDSDSPDYKDIAENPILVNNFTLVNPFAQDMGRATTVIAKNLKKRDEIEEKMNVLAGLIAKVDTGLGQVANAFNPGTFVNNFANNVIVPLVPNFVLKPDVNQAASIAILRNVFSDITRGNAEVGGKLSVQGEKWARENADAIKDPAEFFKNPELAAKVFGTIKTNYFNEYYTLATQLGIGDRNIVVSTPPTGTKSDPFVIPADSEKQQQMLNYLKIQFGAVDDPKALIYIRNPAGQVAATPVLKLFTPRGQ